MAPLSVLLALMLAHPGTSIISGNAPDKKVSDKETQSRRIGVNLAVIPGPSPATSGEDAKEARGEQKRGGGGQQLSGQASHIHGTVYGGHHEGFGGHGGGGGFESFGGGHHGGSGLGFYGGGAGGGGGYGGGDLGGGLEGGLGHGHGDFDHHHHVEHYHDPHLHKALALKSLLVPLAGVALLGAAAAFVTNPILLQLGVISGRRRRRRGAASPDEEQMAQLAQLARQRVGDLQLLEHFMAQIPRSEARAQEQRLLASYLTCTGIVPTEAPPAARATANDSSPTSASSSSPPPSPSSSPSSGLPGGLSGLGGLGGSCLERLACELHQNDTSTNGASPLERHVMRVVTSEILSNEYIPESVKRGVEKSVFHGKHGDDCAKYYPCEDLDDKSK